MKINETIIAMLEANNNTNGWQHEGKFFVDTSKPPKNFESDGFAVTVLYFATREETMNALTGDGPSHNKIFGGRKTWGNVYQVSVK